MKTIGELRELTIKELKDYILILLKDLFNLRMQKVNGTLTKTHQFRLIKKKIAQAKTVMTEKVEVSDGN